MSTYKVKNVLLIEDEPLIQKSLKRLLEKRGAEVCIESAGRAAIKSLQERDYDRIICDLMLQDISGFDIIEEAKHTYASEQIARKFIIITAYSSPQVLKKAESYGCKILSKPFEDLGSALETFLTL